MPSTSSAAKLPSVGLSYSLSNIETLSFVESSFWSTIFCMKKGVYNVLSLMISVLRASLESFISFDSVQC